MAEKPRKRGRVDEGAALVPFKAVGWLSLVEGAALEMRYTRKGIVSSNLTPTALNGILDSVTLRPIRFTQGRPEEFEGRQAVRPSLRAHRV